MLFLMLLSFLLLMELGNKLKKKIAMILLRGVIGTKHIPSFSGNIHCGFTLHGIYILLKVGCFVMVGLQPLNLEFLENARL